MKIWTYTYKNIAVDKNAIDTPREMLLLLTKKILNKTFPADPLDIYVNENDRFVYKNTKAGVGYELCCNGALLVVVREAQLKLNTEAEAVAFYKSLKEDIITAYKNNLKWVLDLDEILDLKPKVIEQSSKPEKEIAKYLSSKNIEFSREKPFDTLLGLGNGNLRFDFAVYKNSTLVFLLEYQGPHHSSPIYGEETYATILEHDKRKVEYCASNNIPLEFIHHHENLEFCLEGLLMKYALISRGLE